MKLWIDDARPAPNRTNGSKNCPNCPSRLTFI